MADATETLKALGQCEAVLEELRRERQALPQRIEACEAQIATAQQTVADARRGLSDAEQRRRTLEGELQDAEAQRAKFQHQTSMVKTNAEYSTLLSEIDQVTARISKIEDGILEQMDEAEQASGSLAEIEREQGAVERHLAEEVEQLRKRLAEVESQSEVHEGERLQLVEALEPAARPQYTRIHRGLGSGTALVIGRGCARCHRDVPFEVINRVSAGEIHSCGNCGRILILNEASG